MVKYIAIGVSYGLNYAGKGETPEAAVVSLKNNEYEGDDNDITIYEVGRQGKPTITVAWEGK